MATSFLLNPQKGLSAVPLMKAITRCCRTSAFKRSFSASFFIFKSLCTYGVRDGFACGGLRWWWFFKQILTSIITSTTNTSILFPLLLLLLFLLLLLLLLLLFLFLLLTFNFTNSSTNFLISLGATPSTLPCSFLSCGGGGGNDDDDLKILILTTIIITRIIIKFKQSHY